MVEDFVIDEPDQKLFHRAPAKTIDDLPDGLGCNSGSTLPAGIDVRAAVHAMFHIAFFFQATKYRARSRFLHEMPFGEGLADFFRRRFPAFPKDVHDELLEIA